MEARGGWGGWGVVGWWRWWVGWWWWRWWVGWWWWRWCRELRARAQRHRSRLSSNRAVAVMGHRAESGQRVVEGSGIGWVRVGWWRGRSVAAQAPSCTQRPPTLELAPHYPLCDPNPPALPRFHLPSPTSTRPPPFPPALPHLHPTPPPSPPPPPPLSPSAPPTPAPSPRRREQRGHQYGGVAVHTGPQVVQRRPPHPLVRHTQHAAQPRQHTHTLARLAWRAARAVGRTGARVCACMCVCVCVCVCVLEGVCKGRGKTFVHRAKSTVGGGDGDGREPSEDWVAPRPGPALALRSSASRLRPGNQTRTLHHMQMSMSPTPTHVHSRPPLPPSRPHPCRRRCSRRSPARALG